MGLAGALTLQLQEATVFLIPQQQKGAGLVTNFQQILHFICIVNQSLLSARRLSQSPGSSCSLPSITFSKKTCASVSSFHHTSATPLSDMALGKTLHYPHLYICVCTCTYTYTYPFFFQELFHYHRYSLQHCFVTTGYKSIRPPLNLLICYLHIYSVSHARLAKMQFCSHFSL